MVASLLRVHGSQSLVLFLTAAVCGTLVTGAVFFVHRREGKWKLLLPFSYLACAMGLLVLIITDSQANPGLLLLLLYVPLALLAAHYLMALLVSSPPHSLVGMFGCLVGACATSVFLVMGSASKNVMGNALVLVASSAWFTSSCLEGLHLLKENTLEKLQQQLQLQQQQIDPLNMDADLKFFFFCYVFLFRSKGLRACGGDDHQPTKHQP